MASQPRLPSELTDLAIEDLRFEGTTLAQCALVCRAWVPAAQRNQFSKLSIHERNCTELIQYLTSATRNVAGYVRCLRVHLWGDLRANLNRATANRTPLLHLLLPHISHFTNVRELELDGCRAFAGRQWDEIWTDLLASALGQSLTHLTVHYLDFEDLPDLVDLVSAFPQLTHLTAEDLDIAEASHEYSNEPQEPYNGSKTPPPLLANIKYVSGRSFASGGGPFLRWLAAGPQAFSTLYLDLDAEAGDVNAGVELVGAARDNLKTLFLNFDDQWGFWEGFELSGNSVLRSLVLRSITAGLFEVLRSVSSPLQHLSFGDVEELDSDAWRDLVDVLMSPSFASLVRIDFYVSSRKHVEDLENEIKGEHPEFFERGIAFFGKHFMCSGPKAYFVHSSSTQTPP
ncbi:hypothetical protein DFH07DRAFT_963520 [Mycena maculata]|uniref:Uncharacterized protein n=1 Tax=Mycena maculata TaxID=230809 RepID=A0AAD7N592_9AGAR|nr:hypothetical protein DFH07DRAFT_963520 [Mycena maculata]